MLNNQKKINIFIPIEIKKRELLSKVILSVFLIKNNKKNVRCYIGSKSQIKKIVFLKKSYGGIFIYKGGLPYNEIKKLKEKIDKFIILDEEMGPTVNYRLSKNITRRIWPGTEKLIDRYYVIGKYASKYAKEVFLKLHNKIKITGWPRVDLWRPKFNHLYKDSVKSLRKRYGNFILFSSDFTFNSKERIDLEKKFWKNSKWEVMKKNQKKKHLSAQKSFFEFKKNMKFIRELDKHPDVPQIIIRPHPSEDLLKWKKINKSLKKIKVVYQGELSSWVAASKGVLHRGCTSSVEAYMKGIPAGFVIVDKKNINKSLPYEISQHLYSTKQITKFCFNSVNKKIVPLKKYSNKFKSTMHVEKKYACEKISDDINKLNTVSELPCNIHFEKYVLDTFIVNLNNLKSYIIKIIKKYIHQVLLPKKIFGGITKKEIENILYNFDINNKFKVRKILKDCIEIE